MNGPMERTRLDGKDISRRMVQFYYYYYLFCNKENKIKFEDLGKLMQEWWVMMFK